MAKQKALGFRDRVIDLRRIKASELVPHRMNPRLHPDNQKAAVSVLLRRIGYADALLTYKLPDGRLQLIDGHLRRDLTPDTEVPVIVTDLNEQEAAMMLAAGDPLASLAQRDDGLMVELLSRTDTDVLAELLAAGDGIAELLGRDGEAVAPDPNAEWQGMPGFEQEDQLGLQVIVRFRSQEDMAQFESLVKQQLPRGVRNVGSIWFPKQEKADLASLGYVTSES